MSKWTVLGACIASVCTLVWCRPSSAAAKARAHLGLETSVVTSTSTDTTLPATTAGTTATSTTKYVSSSTQYGLPGAQALSFGVLISDVVDIGARFGYSNTTVKSGADASAPEITTDEYGISPYVAYLSGRRESRVRFTAGGIVGIGAGNSTVSYPSNDSSSPAPSGKASLSTTQYGVLFGLRLHASDLLSIDPIAIVTSTSAKQTASSTADIEMSGMSFMLNVGFTLWFGGTPTEPPLPKPTTQAWKPPEPSAPGVPAQTLAQPVTAGVPVQTPAQPTISAAPAPTSAPPAVPIAPPSALQGSPTAAAAIAVPAARPADAPAAAAKEKPARLAIPLGEGRSALLMLKQAAETRSISLVLRESRADSNLSTCRQIALNAPYQPELPIPAVHARGITANGPVPILKAEVTVAQLLAMVASPVMDDDGASDHWIDVCGRPWHMGENERARLKGYLDALQLAP